MREIHFITYYKHFVLQYLNNYSSDAWKHKISILSTIYCSLPWYDRLEDINFKHDLL